MSNKVFNTNQYEVQKSSKKLKVVKAFLVLLVLFIGGASLFLAVDKANSTGGGTSNNDSVWQYNSPYINTKELDKSILVYQQADNSLGYSFSLEEFAIAFIEQVLDQIVQDPSVSDEISIYAKIESETVYITIEQNSSQYYTNYAFTLTENPNFLYN